MLSGKSSFSQENVDTIPALNVESNDSTPLVDTNNVPNPSSSISSIINYDAVDSILFDIRKQKATLYGKAHLDYDDLIVDAPRIIVDLKNNTIEAKSTVDSTGKVTEWANLKQKDDEFQAKTIIFNHETKRGYIEDVYMKEGEGYVHTDQAYLDENKNMYVENASYTTCNLAEPHYHFKMNKAKVIPDDKIIASRINLYIDDIPTPLGLPFGLFPSKNERSSGIIIPSPNDNFDGFSLSNGGFYWAINDTIAIKFLGTLYTSGRHELNVTSNYKIRYKYSGTLAFDYQNIVTNNDEFDSESSKTYDFRWKHNPVSKRGRKLTSDVHIQSLKYNRLNYNDTESRSKPTLTSSIRLTLPMERIPFSGTVTMNHQQLNTTGENILRVPNFNFSYTGERNLYKKIPYTRISPSKFRKKFLEQIGITYSMNGNNYATTKALSGPTTPYELEYYNERDTTELIIKDDLQELLDRNKFYMTHTASLQQNIKLGNGAFTLQPSLNYNETWYFSQIDYSLADSTLTMNEDKGFNRISRYNFSTALSTSFYNFYTLGRNRAPKDSNTVQVDRRLKFRQTISPSIRYTLSPDYSEDDEEGYDSFGTSDEEEKYNKYHYYRSSPTFANRSQNITLSLNNTFEMKLPEKRIDLEADPNATVVKREPLKILNLNAATSYDYEKDSLNLSDIRITASNNSILNNLGTITATAQFDPYQYSDGVKINEYWNVDNGSIARLKSLQINSTLKLTPKFFKRKEEKKEEENPTPDKVDALANEYLGFSLPWTLNARHNYSKSQSTPTSDTITTNGLTLSGTLKLSEKWSTSMRVQYDIKDKEWSKPILTLNRDLHCWYMSMIWVPFGSPEVRRYSFTIGVKASMLKDLKHEKKSLYNSTGF